MNPRFRFHVTSFAVFGLVIGLLTSSPIAAQQADLQRLIPASEQEAAKTGSSMDLEVIHVTDRLTNSPEGQQALRNYMEARDAGLLPARKRMETFNIGDEKSFNVLDSIQTKEPTWETRTFVLRSTNNVASVWIDKELNDSFTEENLAELDEHMLHSTPAGSFRPGRGIIENDNYLFGDPPNYDGDGKVDILLYDINEGKAGSCCVLGYVTSTDINPGADEGEGNQADVLYVDLPDGIGGGVSSIAWIVAHEYQHLIHYAYQTPPGSELTFVNEGLSEWASVVNGYFQRGIRYLDDTAEHSTPLLDWNTSENVNDYERAGLFTSYIAQQIGPEATGSIVGARLPRDQGGSYAIGEKGYEVVLEKHDILLSSVIAGFHTANFVNDTSVDPLYGYVLPQRSRVKTRPTTEIDGSAGSSFNRIDFSINPGAVHYFSWTNVANISLQADIADLLSDGPRIQLRAYLESVDGHRAVETIAPGEEHHAFPGDYSRVTLVVVNTEPYSSAPLRLDVRSTWEEGGSSGIVRQTVSYEEGKVDTLFFLLSEEARLANKFAVPEDGRLASVFVAPIYQSDFSNTGFPTNAPRNFRVHVWAENEDGFPGTELFATDVTEASTSPNIRFDTQEFAFVEVDLPDSSVFAQLGDSIFVGISNSGADTNYVTLVPATKSADDAESYLYLNFSNGAGWAPFSGITVGGETIFEHTIHPIRAEFVITTPTDAEDPLELPEQVTLSQNYPNPFNPTTSLTFDVPKTMHVRLAVYDALGRRVATVVDGVRSAGHHTVQIDAGGWASGVYFYTLETDVHTISKRMVLMK